MIEKYGKKYGDALYTLFRVIVGIFFLFHGLMKFGVMSDMMVSVGTMFWFAGIIEIVVGIAVTLGLFTRLAAVFGALEMVVAYVVVHLSTGLNPFTNGGELALLFFAAFLVMIAMGSGPFGAERTMMKKETF